MNREYATIGAGLLGGTISGAYAETAATRMNVFDAAKRMNVFDAAERAALELSDAVNDLHGYLNVLLGAEPDPSPDQIGRAVQDVPQSNYAMARLRRSLDNVSQATSLIRQANGRLGDLLA